MTQEEMAKELGVSAPTYRAYEEDPTKMSLDTAKKFLDAINKVAPTITFEDIFFK